MSEAALFPDCSPFVSRTNGCHGHPGGPSDRSADSAAGEEGRPMTLVEVRRCRPGRSATGEASLGNAQGEAEGWGEEFAGMGSQGETPRGARTWPLSRQVLSRLAGARLRPPLQLRARTRHSRLRRLPRMQGAWGRTWPQCGIASQGASPLSRGRAQRSGRVLVMACCSPLGLVPASGLCGPRFPQMYAAGFYLTSESPSSLASSPS